METAILVKKDIRKASQAELEAFFLANGDKKFRASQVRDWIWNKQAVSFEGMTNLSLPTRSLLAQHYQFRPLEVADE
jgi:23S rRNA (adenine2503-C2)-methyltransferase